VRVRTAILREMGATPPYADSRPLSVEEVELDPPGRGELLVKVGAAGLCHSDLSVIDGSRPRVMPMALGHEAAGEVVEVGEDVTGFAPGDHVVLAFVPACGRCEPCVAGRAALCEPGAAANAAGTLLSGERRLHHPDLDVLHHHLGVSAFSDHIVVSEASAVQVDPELPYELAALFGCAVLTGVGAAVNAARIEPGQRVAVLGLGGVGLSALLGAVLQGAGTIVAVDVVPEKLALALELGATHAVAAGPDAARVLPGLERALPGPAEVHRPAQPGQAAGRAAAHPQAQPRRGERGLRPPGRRRCRAPGDRLRLSPLTHLRGLRELVA
jgi:Zn-dependent alcohol dehydrogenase